MPWEVTLKFVTDPAVFHIVRKSLAAAAVAEGMSRDAASEIEVAVGEALSNAYIHAYGRDVGPLEIDLASDGARVTILIHDHGKPLTDRPAIPGTLPQRGDGRGGRGLYLIGRLMDEAEVIHPGPRGRGTAIRMVKRVR
ncbi:MAG: ATP-binding protein [bacterium]